MIYRVWRCADLKGFPGTAPKAWRRQVCSVCGKQVWVRPVTAEGRVLVCWRCPE